MRKNNRFRSHGLKACVALVALSSFLIGCGQQSYRPRGKSTFAQPILDELPDPIHGADPSPDPSPSSTPRKGVPPLKIRAGTTGYNSVSFQVKTHSTVKVKFTPGTEEDVQYSGLGVYITVGDSTQATPFLYNGLFGGAAESVTLDFSGKFTSKCPDSDPSCRATVTIKVSQPNYDYWCLQNRTGCPWSHVSEDHPWHGTLSVQTDDTDGP